MASISATQKTLVTPKFQDSKGNPAVVDGVPAWSTDNSEVLALTPAADGLSCSVAAVGPIGSATVTLSADAKIGPEVKELMGTLQFDVGPGEATVITLEAGPAEEQ